MSPGKYFDEALLTPPPCPAPLHPVRSPCDYYFKMALDGYGIDEVSTLYSGVKMTAGLQVKKQTCPSFVGSLVP